MNYGKLAYGAMSDLTKRIGQIEKRERYAYASIATSFASATATTEFLSGNFVFRAECDTSLYVRITAEIEAAGVQSANVTVLLDEAILLCADQTVTGGRLSAEANAAQIAKGNHSIRVKIAFASAARTALTVTAYGNGIRENAQHVRATFDTRLLTARKGLDRIDVTDENGQLKLTIPCAGCYEIALIGGNLLCLYTDADKNLYANLYDGGTLRFISSRFLSANVTSCAATRSQGAFEGVCAYVRGGRVFFRAISQSEFCKERAAEFRLASVAEADFVKNADLPVLLLKLQSGRCLALLYQDMPKDGGCIDVAVCAKGEWE